MVDLLIILLLLLCVGIGFIRGVLRSALLFGALIVAYPASGAVTSPFVFLVERASSLSGTASYVWGRAIATVVVYVSLVIAAGLIDRKFGRTKWGMPLRWNRNLGALVGVLVGLLAAFAILCGLDVYVKVLPEREGRLIATARASRMRRLVSRINPADRYLLTDSLKLLKKLQENPELQHEIMAAPEVQKLIDQSGIRNLLQDKELENALRERNIERVLKDERLRNLLKNEDLRKTLFSQDLRQALRQAIEDAEKKAQKDPTKYPARHPRRRP